MKILTAGKVQEKRAAMRFANDKMRFGRRATTVAATVATALGLLTTTVGAGAAEAAPGAEVFRVNSCGMPTGNALGPGNAKGTVLVRAWRRPGNQRTVIMLDGMRAQYNLSGWEINTNVQDLVRRGINVVEPIGGPASFYTDWDAPSNFNGQQARYRWGCVIDNRLVPALRARGFAGKNGKYAIMGLSMGGNAALAHAAQRRDLYYAAASLSGYNFLTAPGMRTALRVAMLDVAPQPWNIDAMWGPPWSPRWSQNDPMMLINRMGGLKLYLGSGNGFFGNHNAPGNFVDDFTKGTPLEMLSLSQTVAFDAAARLQGLNPMTRYSNGTHAWGYWQDMVWDAYNRGFFR